MTQSIKHGIYVCNSHDEAVVVIGAVDKTNCPNCNRTMQERGWMEYKGGTVVTE